MDITCERTCSQSPQLRDEPHIVQTSDIYGTGIGTGVLTLLLNHTEALIAWDRLVTDAVDGGYQVNVFPMPFAAPHCDGFVGDAWGHCSRCGVGFSTHLC